MKKLVPDKTKKKDYPLKEITYCDNCGKEDHWGTSILTIDWGYGSSDYDMDKLTLNLCANCQDFTNKLRKNILKKFKTAEVINNHW